jgi:hypothetical protein
MGVYVELQDGTVMTGLAVEGRADGFVLVKGGGERRFFQPREVSVIGAAEDANGGMSLTGGL